MGGKHTVKFPKDALITDMQYVQETYLPTNSESEKLGEIPSSVSICVRRRGNFGNESHETYQHEKKYNLSGQTI